MRLSPAGGSASLLVAVALVLGAGCGRELPEPGPEERAALAAAAGVPAEPSAGCRPERLGALRAERRHVTVGGEERTYLVDALAADGDRALPLVLSFHGFRGSAWRHRWWTGLGALARRETFIAVHPEGHEGVELLHTTGRGWDVRPAQTRDLAFVRALLDQLEGERCVDRRRVFATGMSNGGFFTNVLGCTLADRLAAIVPVGGAMPLDGCRPQRPLPVLLIHGSADRVVRPALVRRARDWWVGVSGCRAPVEREGCARYTGCAADLVYCEGTQGHRWPCDATARVWRFFRAHPRS